MCNMDCFNCIYPDCINDSIENYEGISDEAAGVERSWYRDHREEVLEKAKKRRAENPEECRRIERERYARNKEKYSARIKERNHRYYWDDPEKARRRSREYYYRKKAEREAQLCKA